jgi:hypothetical protein
LLRRVDAEKTRSIVSLTGRNPKRNWSNAMNIAKQLVLKLGHAGWIIPAIIVAVSLGACTERRTVVVEHERGAVYYRDHDRGHDHDRDHDDHDRDRDHDDHR